LINGPSTSLEIGLRQSALTAYLIQNYLKLIHNDEGGMRLEENELAKGITPEMFLMKEVK
jgi:hypothetical protein